MDFTLREKGAAEDEADDTAITPHPAMESITTTVLPKEEADEGSFAAAMVKICGSFAVILIATVVLFGLSFYRKKRSPHAISVSKSPSDIHQGTVMRNELTSDRLIAVPEDGTRVRTCVELMERARERFATRPCLGTRAIIKEITEDRPVEGSKKKTDQKKSSEGSETKKETETKKWTFYQLAAYEWMTYADVHDRARNLAAAFVQLNLIRSMKQNGSENRPLAMYCETRAEWILVLNACFALRIPVATIYVNLGKEALGTIVDEIEAEAIVTSADLLPNLISVLDGKTDQKKSENDEEVKSQKEEKDTKHEKHGKDLKTVVIVGNQASKENIAALRRHNIEVLQLEDLERKGKSNLAALDSVQRPQPDDTAVIMYTSGTTGKPKGVIMTHANLIAAVAGLEFIVRPLKLSEKDVYLAYLPLSHVLELVVELTLLHCGVAMGYGRVRTLTDQNMQDCKGDLHELKPTLFAGVPSVYETMYAAAKKRIDSLTLPLKLAVKGSMALKSSLMNSFTCTLPILDSIVFKKFAEQLGGRVRFMISGGAALSPAVHEFLRVSLCAPLVQGYGLTESCGMCAAMPFDSLRTNCVGAPISCVELKLIDAPEMQYYAQGVPPRGEILIRGPAVASRGYFKMQEKTAEDFLSDGWFKTGDVGEWDENGLLNIIDRKKNLIKLSGGEYVAVERLEQVYKKSNLVKQVMVHADSSMKQPIAIVIPKEKSSSEDELLQSLQQAAKSESLQQMETVNRVLIAEEEEWSPENDMATAAMKLKRQNVLKKYKEQIENPDEQKKGKKQSEKSSPAQKEDKKEKKHSDETNKSDMKISSAAATEQA